MTLQQLIREKGPGVVADEVQYHIQHHTGIKLPYLPILMTMNDVIKLPDEDVTLEEFVDYSIGAMHERRKTGYLDMP